MIGRLVIDEDGYCSVIMNDGHAVFHLGKIDANADTYNTLKQKCFGDEYNNLEARKALEMTRLVPFFDLGLTRTLGNDEIIGSVIAIVDDNGSFVPCSFYVTKKQDKEETL
ncbi:hypothetical protein GGH95_004181 [Coemansia sp. RSA 1836]|nr:hypothetical protein GGF38_003480 [Coemansia sp. RSA 25]KAJ2571190.1 hypothetical protein GGH95_004181 [Coemansia sp. RSA 1836]